MPNIRKIKAEKQYYEVIVYLKQELYKQVKDKAQELRISKSEYIRRLLILDINK